MKVGAPEPLCSWAQYAILGGIKHARGFVWLRGRPVGWSLIQRQRYTSYLSDMTDARRSVGPIRFASLTLSSAWGTIENGQAMRGRVVRA